MDQGTGDDQQRPVAMEDGLTLGEREAEENAVLGDGGRPRLRRDPGRGRSTAERRDRVLETLRAVDQPQI